jgi:hypothetical protein
MNLLVADPWRTPAATIANLGAICVVVLPDRGKARSERLLASREQTLGFRVEQGLRPLQIPPPNGLAGQPCCTDLLRHRILEI